MSQNQSNNHEIKLVAVTLTIFLLGIALVLYALRLIPKATDRQRSRYFKAMMWSLITPVIALIAIYQIGILLGSPIPFYRADEPFLFISLLLLIPASIIVFLLIIQNRLINASHQNDNLS
jgi:hypothetical protein